MKKFLNLHTQAKKWSKRKGVNIVFTVKLPEQLAPAGFSTCVLKCISFSIKYLGSERSI